MIQKYLSQREMTEKNYCGKRRISSVTAAIRPQFLKVLIKKTT